MPVVFKAADQWPVPLGLRCSEVWVHGFRAQLDLGHAGGPRYRSGKFRNSSQPKPLIDLSLNLYDSISLYFSQSIFRGVPHIES